MKIETTFLGVDNKLEDLGLKGEKKVMRCCVDFSKVELIRELCIDDTYEVDEEKCHLWLPDGEITVMIRYEDAVDIFLKSK